MSTVSSTIGATSRTGFGMRLKATALHLAISFVLVAFVGVLVFSLWYPGEYRGLAGGNDLFWLIVLVDMVLGPFLTFVVFNPAKPRHELKRDLAVVAFIQLVGLGYGVQTLALARPVALVFEVDRFRAISTADLDESDLANAPDWLKAWSWSGPKTLGTKRANGNDELFESVGRATAGIDIAQRPSWWQDYARSVPDVLARAQPMPDLVNKHPAQHALIDAAIARTGRSESSLRWLPLVSRRALDWTALIDATTAEPVGFIHLEGF